MTPAHRHCYACRHYSQTKERSVRRNAKGEKIGEREIHVDRCAARGGAELMVPVVIDTAISLMPRAKFEKLLEDAKNSKQEAPFIYGSEAQYVSGSTMPGGNSRLIECYTFEHQERKYYASEIRNEE